MCECQRGRDTQSQAQRKVREKVQARENERFERDCQNVAGGNVSSEVERSQAEREQEVETIISVCESLRVALCDVIGSLSPVSGAEDEHREYPDPTSGLSEEHAVLASVLLLHQPPGASSACVDCNDLITVCGVTLMPAVTVEEHVCMRMRKPLFPGCISFISSRAWGAAAWLTVESCCCSKHRLPDHLAGKSI